MSPAGVGEVVEWDAGLLGEHADQVLEVYAAAMHVSPASARARRPVLSAHLERQGLRAVAGLDAGRLVGIGYGYRGRQGQWWHDQVRAALDPAAGRRWLTDSFEVCELHVLPQFQGRGLGRAVLDALLTGTPARTAVLTTPDAETRARSFYRVAGWVDLVRELRFPGDPRAFAVLGLQLHPEPA